LTTAAAVVIVVAYAQQDGGVVFVIAAGRRAYNQKYKYINVVGFFFRGPSLPSPSDGKVNGRLRAATYTFIRIRAAAANGNTCRARYGVVTAFPYVCSEEALSSSSSSSGSRRARVSPIDAPPPPPRYRDDDSLFGNSAH